jgi:hypothetical protein
MCWEIVRNFLFHSVREVLVAFGNYTHVAVCGITNIYLVSGGIS